jgi:AcrR family transcriptional regulator
MGKTLKKETVHAKPEDHRVRTGAARREATRQKLLSTALSVFATKGVDASSIDDFIAAAGVARGTFYNYFKTATELLDAVTAELSDEVMASIDEHVSRIDNPIERVATGCLLYMQAAVHHPAWGEFIIQTGIRRGASGKLVDEYLPRDLMLAQDSGQASFPSVRAARDVVLGGIRAGIESVLSGNVPQEHIRDVMQITLTALGVTRSMSKRLSLLELPQLELPPALKPLT